MIKIIRVLMIAICLLSLGQISFAFNKNDCTDTLVSIHNKTSGTLSYTYQEPGQPNNTNKIVIQPDQTSDLPRISQVDLTVYDSAGTVIFKTMGSPIAKLAGINSSASKTEVSVGSLDPKYRVALNNISGGGKCVFERGSSRQPTKGDPRKISIDISDNKGAPFKDESTYWYPLDCKDTMIQISNKTAAPINITYNYMFDDPKKNAYIQRETTITINPNKPEMLPTLYYADYYSRGYISRLQNWYVSIGIWTPFGSLEIYKYYDHAQPSAFSINSYLSGEMINASVSYISLGNCEAKKPTEAVIEFVPIK
jgi:hypothetical protein